jgi:hypothetical protein
MELIEVVILLMTMFVLFGLSYGLRQELDALAARVEALEKKAEKHEDWRAGVQALAQDIIASMEQAQEDASGDYDEDDSTHDMDSDVHRDQLRALGEQHAVAGDVESMGRGLRCRDRAGAERAGERDAGRVAGNDSE